MARSKLDPAALRVLETMDAMGRPPLEMQSVAEARMAREGMIAMAGPTEEVAKVENRSIAGPDGTQLAIRLYFPEDHPKNAPAFLFFHGGGWVLGDLDTHDNTCRALARRSGAVAISVGYRLSPEVKFPAAVDDCQAATLWVARNAALLGIDGERISVVGDSAGGNMATVVAMRCRDNGGPRLALQALIYPVTDMKNLDTPSRSEFADDHFLTASSMQWFTNQYLAKPEDAANPEVSPLLAKDLSRLPPALVITAECDPLCDEGEAYAQRLKEAGVAVTITRYSGMIHAFFSMMGEIPAAHKAVDQVAAAIKGAA